MLFTLHIFDNSLQTFVIDPTKLISFEDFILLMLFIYFYNLICKNNGLLKYLDNGQNDLMVEKVSVLGEILKNEKFDKVDDYIRTQVVKLLYNDGKGKNV